MNVHRNLLGMPSFISFKHLTKCVCQCLQEDEDGFVPEGQRQRGGSMQSSSRSSRTSSSSDDGGDGSGDGAARQRRVAPGKISARVTTAFASP